ncbi:gas vesicle protein GvpJ [Natrinema longum]|uniref:Gas vesicle protein n=1 Tax=Natrinema longum TaxID=370324 RepID=A0A8A2U753_9EURY|nr:gas vesicle protein [Natrinema longum]MBZ6494606.1 gas vesicle protein [Natrinema longum]QSW84075.1 gas vesicle protein [Natrinema longum]
MSGPKPTRNQGDLAQMLDTLLDKGVVINADIAVTVGDTELLGVQIRAAIASFETAAEYGLEFPGGTDMARVREAAGVDTPRVATTDEAAEDATLEKTDSSPAIDAVDAGEAVAPDDREGADTSGRENDDR